MLGWENRPVLSVGYLLFESAYSKVGVFLVESRLSNFLGGWSQRDTKKAAAVLIRGFDLWFAKAMFLITVNKQDTNLKKEIRKFGF